MSFEQSPQYSWSNAILIARESDGRTVLAGTYRMPSMNTSMVGERVREPGGGVGSGMGYFCKSSRLLRLLLGFAVLDF